MTAAVEHPPADGAQAGVHPTPKPARRRRRFLFRLIVVWVLSAAALMLASGLLANVDVKDFAAALGAAALIGLVNALIWPVAMRLLLPITVLTLGLGALVLNGGVVLLVSEIDAGLEVDTLWAAIATAIVLTVVTTAASSLLAVDDDEFFFRNVVKRQARRGAAAVDTTVPGLLFLEIDGLAHDVLLRAIRDGNAPTLARWLRDGLAPARALGDRLVVADRGLPGRAAARRTTTTCRRSAGGRRTAARRSSRTTRRTRWSSSAGTRTGAGCCYADGASRANILSGDAPHSLLTMSTVAKRDRPGRIGQDYFAYFANPYNVTRTFALVIREVVSELWSAAQQRRLDVQPRVHRGFAYALMRAWGTIIQRDLQVQAVIADMYAGRPVTYTTFLAYDEVAHHSGIERPETLLTLRRVDRELGRIAAAAAEAARPYRARRALRPRAVAGRDVPGPLRHHARAARHGRGRRPRRCRVPAAPDEALGYLGAGLTEASRGDGAGGARGARRHEGPQRRRRGAASSRRRTARRRTSCRRSS